jgi:GNAT superfamily N-acetyltransferase
VPVSVRRADPERLPVLASVLGRAFVAEPMVCWPFGDGGDVEEKCIRTFEYLLEEIIGLGIVWEAGEALGASTWFSPDDREAWEAVQIHDRRVGALTDDDGARYDAFWEWVDARIPAEPVWHLDSIGVEPSIQGRGVGTALMEHGLERALASGAAVVLETAQERNVPYFERFGFRTVEDADSPGDGPHVWFMRREPEPAAQASMTA